MDTNNKYIYSPLSGPRSTRLIMLHPSKAADAPLSCELVEIDMDRPPAYQALSYTWNGEAPSEPMTVSAAAGRAGPGTQPLLVTPNCADALRLLRRRIGRGRRVARVGLWVDAICIDQGSDQEKSVQVAAMSDIYKNAETVVVWLGKRHAPAAWGSLLPVQFFGFLSFTKAPHLSLTLDMLYEFYEEKTHKLLWKASHKTIADVRGASYWSRVWTLQEFAHRSAALLCLDSRLYPFRRLRLLPMIVPQAEEGEDALLLHNMHFNSGRYTVGGMNPVPSAFWASVSGKTASDGRDKVFALRGVFPYHLGSTRVDYGRSAEDVFAAATRDCVAYAEDLETLYYSCQPTDLALLPSWAVDWQPKEPWSDTAVWGAALDWSSACGRADAVFRFSEDGLGLELLGKEIGKVGGCVGERFPPVDLGSREITLPSLPLINEVSRFMSAASESCPDAPSKPASSLRSVLAWYLQWESWSDYVHWSKDLGPEELQDVPAIIIENIRASYFIRLRLGQFLEQCRLFLTTDGRAGVGFHTILPGDSICVFAGLKRPFVVRPRGSGYALVGPVLVDGAMSGELWPENRDELQTWQIV